MSDKRFIVIVLVLLSFLEEVPADQLVIPRQSLWKCWSSEQSVPANWSATDFDDSSWAYVSVGVGYGDGDDTTILEGMQGRYDKVYLRKSFSLKRDTDSLLLRINYDDAFVAYINGDKVIQGGFNQNGRIEDHEAMGYESFVLKGPFKAGKNVVAIVGYNAGLNSSDFTLEPYIVLPGGRPLQEGLLSREMAIDDLEELKRRILGQSSYYKRRLGDPIGILTHAQQAMPEVVSRSELVRMMNRGIAAIGDSHASVRGGNDERGKGQFIPFRLAMIEDRVVAVERSRERYVVDDCRYVDSIDDLPMSDWLKTASEFVANGSKQLRDRRALFFLQRVDVMREVMNLPASDSVVLVFSNRDSSKTERRTFKLRSLFSSQARVKIANQSRIVDPNIGYLRIAQMNNDLIPQVHDWMKKFSDTDGLIIDVRGNGGGRYGILHALYPYFQDEGDYYVSNVCAYRLAPHFKKNHLYYRPTFPASHSHWNAGERAAIAKLADGFKPEWNVPKGEFSEWHYAVLGRRTKHHYRYSKPVIVLSDSVSFSATDGFLGAFSDLKQVKLVGQPSAGGSGATQTFYLKNSGLQAKLASMASFRPNGMSYDGNGVAVDVEIWPAARDLLWRGDEVLDRAIEMLSQ